MEASFPHPLPTLFQLCCFPCWLTRKNSRAVEWSGQMPLTAPWVLSWTLNRLLALTASLCLYALFVALLRQCSLNSDRLLLSHLSDICDVPSRVCSTHLNNTGSLYLCVLGFCSSISLRFAFPSWDCLNLFMYLLLSVFICLWLCCPQVFSSCGDSGGTHYVCNEHRLLITVAYLAPSVGLERRLGSWHTDLVSEAHGVFWTTQDPCPGRRIINDWTTRKSLYT